MVALSRVERSPTVCFAGIQAVSTVVRRLFCDLGARLCSSVEIAGCWFLSSYQGSEWEGPNAQYNSLSPAISGETNRPTPSLRQFR